MIDPTLLKAVARSDYKNNLVNYLEQLKAEIADVRVGTYSLETRQAVIKIVDDMILNKIRVVNGPVDKKPTDPIDDYR